MPFEPLLVTPEWLLACVVTLVAIALFCWREHRLRCDELQRQLAARIDETAELQQQFEQLAEQERHTRQQLDDTRSLLQQQQIDGTRWQERASGLDAQCQAQEQQLRQQERDHRERLQQWQEQQRLQHDKWLQQSREQLELQQQRTREQLEALQQRSREQIELQQQRALEQQQKLNNQLRELQAQLASEQQARQLQEQHSAEKLQLLQSNREQLLQEFELLSQKIYEQKQQQFSEQSQQGLNSLLNPFREQLDGLRRKVEDVYVTDSKDRAALQAQITELHKLNQQITSEAHALTTALRGEHKTQGNWGEMVLENVLERSGLRLGHEYLREESHQDAGGQRYRPDVVIRLPEGKHLIVDSKVSLTAYTDYVNAADESSRETALKRHLDSVRAHIKGLGAKAYQHLEGVRSPDFVFMFMPVEPAFVLAFQQDQNLFNQAFEQKIVVVTPTTLLATLRTVASLWAMERRNRSTEELADQARKLYDKLVVVVEKFEKVGNQLETVNKSWDDAWKSLKNGRGNLISQADRFVTLGVQVKKELSQGLLDEARASDELHQALAGPDRKGQ